MPLDHSHDVQNENKTHVVFVNDEIVSLKDSSPIGRQITAAAGLHPVDEFALLQLLPDGSLEEINSDEAVSLDVDGKSEFYAFRTDRLFYFIFNDRKYPWKSDLPESLIRKLGNVSDNQDIWLERKDLPDEKIERGMTVTLAGDGVEHFYSAVIQDHESFEIIINGRKKKTTENELSYEQVVHLAFPDGPFGESIIYTVSYSDPHSGVEGSLVAGMTVKIKNRMIFNVSKTDRS